MDINKRILVAVDQHGDIGTDTSSEPFVVPINDTTEEALEILRDTIKEDYVSDIDDYTFVEYKAVRQYVADPKWIDVR